MRYTENYRLPQIELEDNYDIEHFNDGWRKTDEELKRLDVEVQKRVNYDDTEIRELINETNTSLDKKQNKTDNALNTISKEIIGSINEINSRINKEKSLTATGYDILPSGLILQWGEGQLNLVDQNTGSKEMYFPKAFPTRAFTVIVCANSNGITNTSAFVVQCYDIYNNKFTTRATHCNFTNATGRVSFSWFAIGI